MYTILTHDDHGCLGGVVVRMHVSQYAKFTDHAWMVWEVLGLIPSIDFFAKYILLWMGVITVRITKTFIIFPVRWE